MVKQNRELLKMCASIIMSMIITTQIKDKEKLISVAEEMNAIIQKNEDYPDSMKRAYNYSCEFLQHIWTSDFNKIVEIALKEKD